MAKQTSEGELFKKLEEMSHYASDPVNHEAKGLSDITSDLNVVVSTDDFKEVLGLARADFVFDENEPMWQQFLSAQKGESGDYPDTVDFILWLVAETQKLLNAKKRWFGVKKQP